MCFTYLSLCCFIPTCKNNFILPEWQQLFHLLMLMFMNHLWLEATSPAAKQSQHNSSSPSWLRVAAPVCTKAATLLGGSWATSRPKNIKK